MKKISILAAAAVVAVSAMVSCNGSIDSGKPTNSLDTLSVAMGEMYGYGWSQQVAKTDTAFDKNEFMRGFEMAINVDTANDSYRQGMMLGAQLIEMVKGLKEQNQVQLNTYLLVAEFKRAFMSDSTVNLMMLQGNVNMLMQAEMRAVKERDPQAIENAEAGKKFIEDLVKNDPDVVVTESGLAYKVVKPGNGKKFAESDRIMTRYKGSKIDGTVFDQTKDKETRSMSPRGVVPGFKEGLLLMSPGASYILYIPGDLAYGVDGRSPKIGPNELLIFEVETVGVEPAKKK